MVAPQSGRRHHSSLPNGILNSSSDMSLDLERQARIEGNTVTFGGAIRFPATNRYVSPPQNPATVYLLVIPPDSQLLWGRPRRLSGPRAMHGRRPVQPDRGD